MAFFSLGMLSVWSRIDQQSPNVMSCGFCGLLHCLDCMTAILGCFITRQSYSWSRYLRTKNKRANKANTLHSINIMTWTLWSGESPYISETENNRCFNSTCWLIQQTANSFALQNAEVRRRWKFFCQYFFLPRVLLVRQFGRSPNVENVNTAVSALGTTNRRYFTWYFVLINIRVNNISLTNVYLRQTILTFLNFEMRVYFACTSGYGGFSRHRGQTRINIHNRQETHDRRKPEEILIPFSSSGKV